MTTSREQGRIVRNYLDAVTRHKPQRGRPRTVESIDRDIEKIDHDMASADSLGKLELVQRKIDLQAKRTEIENPTDLSSLEAEFVRVAKDYGDRKKISAAAWREVGVSAATLKAAGIA
jgi:glycerol-3-phosphate cytidylyltransferase-like family protein